MTPTVNERNSSGPASVIALLAGIWFFVSPWIYGASTSANAWNSWIAGALMAIFALIRLSQPRTFGVSWLNVLLGIWAFASPWIYGYTGNSGRFINSLCVGVIVFCAGLVGTHALTHRGQPTHSMR